MYGISDESRILRADFASRSKSSRRLGFTAGASGGSVPVRRNAPCTDDELELLIAVDRFKQATGKGHPTPSDLFRIMKSLGYVRPAVAPPSTPETSD